MVDEIMGSGIVPDLSMNPVTNTPTSESVFANEQRVQAERDAEVTLFDEAVTTSNTIYDVAAGLAIELGTEDEDGYNVAERDPEVFDGIGAEWRDTLASSGSSAEAWAKRGRIDQYLENQQKLAASGITGMMASTAAGIVDADALLLPMTGGTYLGTKLAATLGKAGATGKTAAAAVGAARGIEAGAVVGAASLAGVTGDVGDVPGMLLSGLAFGSTLGSFDNAALVKNNLLEQAKKTHIAYETAKAGGFAAQRVPSKSVGAAAVIDVVRPAGLRESTISWFDRAVQDGNARNARRVLTGELDAETTNVESLIGRAAQRAQNWVDKSPLKSLYTSVSNLGHIGNKVAYDLLYHPGGMVDGAAHPAAGYDYMYHQELSVPLQRYHEYAATYLNRPRNNIAQKAKTALFTRKSEYLEFDKAVMYEMETRYHTGKSDPNAHPAVKAFADDLDAMHSKAVETLQGRAGETPVNGSEGLKHKPGYFTRRWHGESLKRFDKDAVHAALVTAYRAVLPPGTIEPADLDAIVGSIITRSRAMEDGIDTNLVGLLRDNGKEFLRDTLRLNQMTDDKIDAILAALTGKADERSKPGFLKDRIELDLRTPIPGTDATLLDLLDPDFKSVMHKYTRKVAGTAALARKGYQLSDKTDLIEAIKDEIVANGGDAKDPRIDDMLETAFSYFGAGAVGKGVDPVLLSAMRATRQSLLGSLGLTQLSELGNTIALSGMSAVMRVLPDELRAAFSGKDTPLIRELHDAFIFMDKDHFLHDDELALDLAGRDPVIRAKFLDTAHRTLAFGDKIAGYTSLFYQSMAFSQRLAVSSLNSKIYSMLARDLTNADYRRLMDMGFSERLIDRMRYYKDKGVVKTVDGELTLGLKDWKDADLQEYKLALHQFVGRAVQKNMPGEVPMWATTQIGQFMAQLRMFPLMALQKQALRNLRHADQTTAAAFLWNLAVAGMVYSVSETIKGRGDKLTTDRIAKGALNYAPTTGWLPMATDPLAEIMGFPELRINQYGPPGRATEGIIPVPAAIPTLNRLLHVPGAAIGALDGVDRQEASALAATPIVGSAYGFSALFNHLKESE